MNPNTDRWLESYNEGKTHEEIALDDGVSINTVGDNLRKHPDYVPRKLGNRGTNLHRPIKDKKPSIKTVIRPGARAAHRTRGRGW